MCNPRPQSLLDNLDRDMQYAITHDAHWALEDCDNYQEVRGQEGDGECRYTVAQYPLRRVLC